MPDGEALVFDREGAPPTAQSPQEDARRVLLQCIRQQLTVEERTKIAAVRSLKHGGVVVTSRDVPLLSRLEELKVPGLQGDTGPEEPPTSPRMTAPC